MKQNKDKGLFKRSDSPNWWMCYSDRNGHIRRLSTGTTMKSLARDILNKKKTEVAENRHLDVKKIPNTTFYELCEQYWTQCGQHMRTKGLPKIIEIWKKAFGNVPVKELDQLRIERFLNQHMEQHELTTGTRNRHLAMLRAMFNKGVQWGIVAENPAVGIKKLRETPPRDRFLSLDEIKRLLALASDSLRPIIITALHTGMRHGEILNLQWPDVDFVNKLIKVRESKSGKSRSIPMDQTLFEILRGLTSRFAQGFVFPNQRTHVNQTFRRLCRKAKIENFRFHDLRHTFASYLTMEGVPINTVQEYLGHGSLAMTMRYSHLAPSFKREKILILDSVFGTDTKTDTAPTNEKSRPVEVG